MSFVLLFIYFFVLSYFLSRWKWVRHSGIKSNVIVALFSVKILAGFGLVYLYGHFYNPLHSDIFLYFNNAVYLKHLFFTDKSLFIDILLNRPVLNPIEYDKYTHLQYWDSSGVDFLFHEKRLVILINLAFSFFTLNNIYIHSMLMAFIGLMISKMRGSFRKVALMRVRLHKMH